jgi:hypothetical protein
MQILAYVDSIHDAISVEGACIATWCQTAHSAFLRPGYAQFSTSCRTYRVCRNVQYAANAPGRIERDCIQSRPAAPSSRTSVLPRCAPPTVQCTNNHTCSASIVLDIIGRIVRRSREECTNVHTFAGISRTALTIQSRPIQMTPAGIPYCPRETRRRALTIQSRGIPASRSPRLAKSCPVCRQVSYGRPLAFFCPIIATYSCFFCTDIHTFRPRQGILHITIFHNVKGPPAAFIVRMSYRPDMSQQPTCLQNTRSGDGRQPTDHRGCL